MTIVAEPRSTSEPAQPERQLYDPARIRSLIGRWPEICVLALNPHTARGLVRPNLETRDAPRFKIPRGYHGDNLTWADLHADVERAWLLLRGDGSVDVERRRHFIVGYRMMGIHMDEIGQQKGVKCRTETVVAEFAKACKLMAETLGYESPTESGPAK